MNIGLVFPFRSPPQWRKPFPQFYAEQLRQIQIAESLRFAEANDFPGAEQMAQLPPASELRHITDQLIDRPIIGTHEDVRRQITIMTKQLRMTHLVMGMHMPGLDPVKSQQSMELFAKEVMPGLR